LLESAVPTSFKKDRIARLSCINARIEPKRLRSARISRERLLRDAGAKFVALYAAFMAYGPASVFVSQASHPNRRSSLRSTARTARCIARNTGCFSQITS
jgi:hypothetical protein